jgi:hypothetical protein
MLDIRLLPRLVNGMGRLHGTSTPMGFNTKLADMSLISHPGSKSFTVGNGRIGLQGVLAKMRGSIRATIVPSVAPRSLFGSMFAVLRLMKMAMPPWVGFGGTP